MVFGLKLGLAPKKAPEEPPKNESVTSGKQSGSKSALTVNEFVARTKRCREKGLEPTKPELIAYARYLGIDPIVDGDLMWIADEALSAPLPSEWTEHHDSADRIFFYNVQTHASSWTHPLEQLHRDTYKCIVNFRSGDLSKEERTAELEKLRRKCEEAEREAHRELQAWSEHTDEQGQKFFYNREHRRSVWTDPRPARCHALYLQMKALRVMSKQLGQAGPAGSSDSPRVPIESPRGPREDLLPRHGGRRNRERGGLGEPPDAGAVEPPSGPFGAASWAAGGASALEEDEGIGGEGRKRNRRKKQREGEASSRQQGGGGELPASDLPGPNRDRDGGLPWQGSLLDMKRPNTSAVEEVRQICGVSSDLRLPPIGRGQSSSFGGGSRFPSMPGDELSTVGHAKVRAGIRLQPLQGGA